MCNVSHINLIGNLLAIVVLRCLELVQCHIQILSFIFIYFLPGSYIYSLPCKEADDQPCVIGVVIQCFGDTGSQLCTQPIAQEDFFAYSHHESFSSLMYLSLFIYMPYICIYIYFIIKICGSWFVKFIFTAFLVLFTDAIFNCVSTFYE